MWAVAGLVCFGLALLAHSIACRMRIALNAVFKFAVVALGIGVALTIWLLSTYGVSIEAGASLLVYALVCELYVFTFTLVGSSVSASILMRLRASGLTADEIERAYSAEYMVESRFSKLVKNGFLLSDNGSYTLTARGERVLGVFERLRLFFRHANGKSDSGALRASVGGSKNILEDRAQVRR
jgi:hypothetical protein